MTPLNGAPRPRVRGITLRSAAVFGLAAPAIPDASTAVNQLKQKEDLHGSQ